MTSPLPASALPDAPSLIARTKDLGFFSAGLCRVADYPREGLPELDAPEGARAVLMAALGIPGAEGETDLSSPEDPQGLVAPFAQKNYYAHAGDLLKVLAAELGERYGFARKAFRVFVNSRFPEKPLAILAGLGVQGKNTLVLTPRRGSRQILAGVFLPFEPEGLPADGGGHFRGDPCGGCDLCLRACPGGALLEDRRLDRSRCLQAMSTGPMPREFRRAWGTRIYGCGLCQNVCPLNPPARDAGEIPAIRRGTLGPSLSLKTLLDARDGVKDLLKGTVLDRNWVEGGHILRNALVAAGNHPRGPALRREVEGYLEHPDGDLREAAEWALEQWGF